MDLFLHHCSKEADIPVGQYIMIAMSYLETNKPRVEMSHIRKEFQDRYFGSMRNYGINYLGGARAGIVLCSLIFHHHCIANQDIDPQIATGIVALGTLEASRTVPPPLRAAITKPRIMRTDSIIART